MSAGQAPSLPPAAPDGLRLYAIGDVHGCRAHLRRLLARIAEDAAGAPSAPVRLILLGDYVDRGPDSAGVLDDVLRLAQAGLSGVGPVELVTLRGNHEDFMLRFLAGDDAVTASWLFNGGGAETLESYDVEPPGLELDPADVGRARAALNAALPDAHRRFLEGLAASHRAGGYFFAHAGVRPGVPLDRQEAEDLMWIRKPFLESEADFGAVVVHGHTPVAQVEERPNRIDLDTGAVYGGRLTAACFWGTERRYLDVSF